MQPNCTEPNQLDTKGKREEERGRERGEMRGKRREKRGFLQKNRILQIFVGII